MSEATSRFRAWCSRVLRIACSRRSRLNGFSMKSWTPSRRASTVSLIDASPEMMIVGGKRCAAARRRTRSTPLMRAQADVEEQEVGEGAARVLQMGGGLLGRGQGVRGVPLLAELEEEAGADLLVVLDDQQAALMPRRPPVGGGR